MLKKIKRGVKKIMKMGEAAVNIVTKSLTNRQIKANLAWSLMSLGAGALIAGSVLLSSLYVPLPEDGHNDSEE